MKNLDVPEWAKPSCPECGSWKGMWHNETCPIRMAEMQRVKEISPKGGGAVILNAGDGYNAMKLDKQDGTHENS